MTTAGSLRIGGRSKISNQSRNAIDCNVDENKALQISAEQPMFPSKDGLTLYKHECQVLT